MVTKWDSVDLPKATRFLNFVSKTGSPYHSVLESKKLLFKAGFTELHEGSPWILANGSSYFVTRNGSSILAFTIGKEVKEDKYGFLIVAAHTDSPCLRVRPNNNLIRHGCMQVSVECYGGGLWHTWFDRGLGLCGKVLVKGSDNAIVEKLVRIDKPILVLPNLAIHMLNAEERTCFKVDKEENLQPIISTIFYEKMCYPEETSEGTNSIPLLRLLAAELECKESEIVTFDLCLMDTCPSQLGGINEEFVVSPRLDDLVCSYSAFEALTNPENKTKEDISVAISFDHEEVGSNSFTGAKSNVLPGWIHRIHHSLFNNTESVDMAFSRSFLISADMAHALHPNYPSKSQGLHQIYMHKGIVFKENSDQRYATECTSLALMKALAEKADVPTQNFVVKNDMGCGSTVGPMVSAKLGIRTIDIGIAQWAMHSIRETCSTLDLLNLYLFLQEFYRGFRLIKCEYL